MDPEGGGSGSGPPLKIHKNIGFSSNTGPYPLKNRSYQASIQCWAIIDTPAKRHLMAFSWRTDDGLLIVVLGSSLPSSTEKKTRLLQNFLDQRMKMSFLAVGNAALFTNLYSGSQPTRCRLWLQPITSVLFTIHPSFIVAVKNIRRHRHSHACIIMFK